MWIITHSLRAECAKIISNQICPGAVKKFFIALSFLLLLPGTASMAMSLGRLNGAALIGRPLDMSVQAVLEPQDDASNLCMEADVFYADNKLDKSRVRVTLEKSPSSVQQGVIRIRSAVLVDEPVVTLVLRVGCQPKTERRYVSLADLVSEAVPDRNTPAAMPLPSTSPSRPVANSAGSTSTVQGLPIPPIKDPASARKPIIPRAPAATQVAKTAAPAKARLKLEPLDLVMERDPQLKASAELLSIPAANPQERAAANALWRALSAQPQDILRDTEKLQSLENSVRGLQAQSQKTLTSIDDLNVKLQQAQADRYTNALVYGLIFLLLATLAGLAYALIRKNSIRGGDSGDKPWWRKKDANQSHRQAWFESLPSHEPYESGAARFASGQKSSPVDIHVDFDLYPAAKSASVLLAGVPVSAKSVPLELKDKSGFGSSQMHPSRAVKAEELFDVQQQADFFVSIGQHEQAIELLRSHIAENLETSALVYLDLFNLYHQLERPAEYDALRVNFNKRFNTQIPTFKLYTDKNLGLEAYQNALSRIEALWPSPKVLEVIEESLFKNPDKKAEAFSLEAYRELLMLYSVVKDIISRESTAQMPGKKFYLPNSDADSGANSGAESGHSRSMTFLSTDIQPLSASAESDHQVDSDLNIAPLTVPVIPPVSIRLGLDIDLEKLNSVPGSTVNLLVRATEKHSVEIQTAGADTLAALPALDLAPLRSTSIPASTDNLIDFADFDVASVASKSPQLPKV